MAGLIPSYDMVPSSPSDSLPWVSTVNYTPVGYCNDIDDGTGHFKPGVFNIVELQEGMRYEYVHTGIGHFNYKDNFHMGTALYTIKCGNNITYAGSRYFEVEDHQCDILLADCGTPDGLLSVVDLSNLNTTNWTYNTIGQTTLTVPVADIFTTLNNHHVTFPEYTFTGTPGKLARPVLLVHGLNSDFKVWGAIPVVDSKADPSFRAAKVKGYLNGTLPDMLQRSQNLDIDYDHNGIYFFQSPGAYAADSSWVDALPLFSNDSATSQSRALYGRIQAVLNDYFTSTQGKDWTQNDSLKIDLVCHSQGGLAVREMLRGLQGNAAFPVGTLNAANHIHKIVTVNTPHFGSALASEPAEIENLYPGLSTLISDLDAPDANRELISMDINVDTWTKVKEGTSAGLDGGFSVANPKWADGTPMGVLGIVTGPVGALVGAIGGPFTDVSVKLIGPYLGPYTAKLEYDVPGPFNSSDTKSVPDELAGMRASLTKARVQTSYLGWGSNFIRDLKTTGFPTRPDGSKLVMLPLYSDSTGAMVSALLGQISKGATKFCDQEYPTEAGCFSLGDEANKLAKEYGSGTGVQGVSGVNINDSLLTMLTSFQNDWLKGGDAVVEASSQKMIDASSALDPSNQNLKGFFQTPRKYLIHSVQAPWEPVLHGPFNFSKDVERMDVHAAVHNPGATRMGSDLLCALDETCSAALTKSTRALLRVSSTPGSAVVPALNMTSGLSVATQSLALTGNFNVQPVVADTGYHGVALRNADSSFRLVAAYQPGYGAYVWYLDDAGVAQSAMLTPSDIMANVSIARQGTQVVVTATNYSGKAWADTLTLASLPTSTTIAILGNAGTVPASLLVGSGTATNPATQVAPVAPATSIWNVATTPAPLTVPVVVYHREARSAGETATSRPRFLVRNISASPIQGFKVAYYFTADSARNPAVEFDSPQASHTLEHLGGDQWRFVIDASQISLDTGAFYPNTEGWQIRLHYGDWTEWNHWRDYSADQSMGQVKSNAKIVVYALDGSILWGKEPVAQDQSLLKVAATVQVTDAAPWETTTFKPQFTIQNTGAAPLANYHALYYFQLPAGKALQPPASDWYTPDAQLSARSLGNNLWVLDVLFDKYILYPGQTIVERDMGLRLVDWSTFDKTQVGLALTDSMGNVIAGSLVAGDSTVSSSSSTPSSSSSTISDTSLQVKVLDQSDANYLRARIQVKNLGITNVSGFDLSFRVVTENGKEPLLSVWSVPSCTTNLNELGGGLYGVDLHCTDLALAPNAVWPDDAGATFGLNYGDWSNWDASNDPSMTGVSRSGWTISSTIPITQVTN